MQLICDCYKRQYIRGFVGEVPDDVYIRAERNLHREQPFSDLTARYVRAGHQACLVRREPI
jgi:hypothetical protein